MEQSEFSSMTPLKLFLTPQVRILSTMKGKIKRTFVFLTAWLTTQRNWKRKSPYLLILNNTLIKTSKRRKSNIKTLDLREFTSKSGSRLDMQRCFDSQTKLSRFTSKTRLKFCLTLNKNESPTQTKKESEQLIL